MATRLEVGIENALERMDGFQCKCEAIRETHRKSDCTPMWHARSWHGATVRVLDTVEEANCLYPPLVMVDRYHCGCDSLARP